MFQIDENELRSRTAHGGLSPALFQSARSSVDPMIVLFAPPACCRAGEAERLGVRGDQTRSTEFTPASYKNQDYSINIDWLNFRRVASTIDPAGRLTSPRLRGEVGVRAKRGLRVRGRFHGGGASDNAKHRRGNFVRWVDSTLLVSSAHAGTPPHPALRADLSPQAGRGNTATLQ